MITESRKIKVSGQEVVLDTTNLQFSEANLQDYLEREGAEYAYFGSRLADAEREVAHLEAVYDLLYDERFKEHKAMHCSDKLAESSADADPDVCKAKVALADGKHRAKLLLMYLRAYDKTHENAQNRSNTIRKEIDKLFHPGTKPNNYLEDRLTEIVQSGGEL